MAERYRVGDVLKVQLVRGQLVSSRRSGAARILSPQQVTVLGCCQRFATLHEHARAACRALRLGEAHIGNVLHQLKELAQEGFLISSTELCESFARAAHDGDDNDKISTIGFVTGNRAVMLQCALSSFAANARKFERGVEFVVMDDSSSAESRAVYKQMLKTERRENGAKIIYAGSEEKTQFANALARESGVAEDVVQFGMFGEEHCGSRCGANRNCLLLHTVGELVFSADDDVVCRVGSSPQLREGLMVGSRSGAMEFWFYPDRAAAMEAVRWEERDVLALHETMLGKSIGTCIATDNNGEANLDGVDSRFFRSAAGNGGRVTATMLGLVGDCAVDWPRWFLLGSNSHRRLVASEMAYRSAFTSREILRSVSQMQISSAPRCMTYAIGLDNRVLLPPFFPVGRAMDGVFSITMLTSLEESFCGHLPWVIEHSPQETRTFTAEYVRTDAASRGLWSMVDLCIRSCQFGLAKMSSTQRMQKLGQHLTEMAAMSAADFEEQIRVVTWQQLSQTLASIDQLLQTHRGQPEFWARDVRQYAQTLREVMAQPEFVVPSDLRKLHRIEDARALAQRLVGRFGQLMQAWPDLVNSARRLRERGVCLAQVI